MKRLVSIFLTFVMCISLSSSLTTTASAASVKTGEMQDTSSDDNGTIYWELTYTLTTASLRISGDGYMPNGTDQCWRTALGSRKITELVIEEGVKSIMEGAFYGEDELKYVTLPSTLEFIGDSAFADTAIEFVTLPKNLRDFNGTIFNSQSFTQYSVSPENPYYKAIDGVVYSKDLTKLIAYPVGRNAGGGKNSFVIPETVTEIGKYAFMNCKHTSFTIPGTVKDIQYQSFAGNTELKSLVIENGVENIYDNAFLACNKLIPVHLPTSVNYIGYCSFGFVYTFDFEGLEFMLDQKGIEYENVNEDNVAYYASLTGFSLDCFIICVVDENVKIYAPTNSAGHNYCKMFGVTYYSSEAVTPTLISAKQTVKGVEFKWTKSSDADGYYVYRKNKSGRFEKIATVKGKEKTSYTDSKAFPSYKNTYTVKAYNENGTSRHNVRGVSAYYIPAPQLTAATNLNNGIKVAWKRVSTATNYNIYRKTEGSNKWEHIGITDKSRLYFVDKDVENLKKYQYTVRAYDKESISAYDTKGLSRKYIATPKISAFKNTAKGIQISWKKVSGATSYYVYKKVGNGEWKIIQKLKNNIFTYTDTNVKSGVKYSYAIKAVGTGMMSGYFTQTTEYLKQPNITSAKSTKNGIILNYSQTPGADGYRIYRKVSGEKVWTRIATLKGVSKVSYTDKNAKKGVTYYYTVKAYSGSYNSAYNSPGYKIKDKY